MSNVTKGLTLNEIVTLVNRSIQVGGYTHWLGTEQTYGYIIGVQGIAIDLPETFGTAYFALALVPILTWLSDTRVYDTVGGWTHKGKLYIDFGYWTHSLDVAHAWAVEHNQLAFWDIVNDKEVPTDSELAIK